MDVFKEHHQPFLFEGEVLGRVDIDSVNNIEMPLLDQKIEQGTAFGAEKPMMISYSLAANLMVKQTAGVHQVHPDSAKIVFYRLKNKLDSGALFEDLKSVPGVGRLSLKQKESQYRKWLSDVETHTIYPDWRSRLLSLQDNFLKDLKICRHKERNFSYGIVLSEKKESHFFLVGAGHTGYYPIESNPYLHFSLDRVLEQRGINFLIVHLKELKEIYNMK